MSLNSSYARDGIWSIPYVCLSHDILELILAWCYSYIWTFKQHWFSQWIGKEKNDTCIFNKFLGTHFLRKHSCYYLKTSVIAFPETSKSVGLITSGWHVTFWPSVNMQHWPDRLPWGNLLCHPDHRGWLQHWLWRQIQILSCFRKAVSDTK